MKMVVASLCILMLYLLKRILELQGMIFLLYTMKILSELNRESLPGVQHIL
jgi:hypothetical protein